MAVAADNCTPVIEPDPVQPGEIRLHSWMLYTPQAPVLDLREETITSTSDLRDAFHRLCLCPNKEISDSDISEEEQVNPQLRT